jgi:hypothetical protein
MAIHIFAQHPHARALYNQLIQWCSTHLNPHHLWKEHSTTIVRVIVNLIKSMLKEIEPGGKNVKKAFEYIVGTIRDLWRDLVG